MIGERPTTTQFIITRIMLCRGHSSNKRLFICLYLKCSTIIRVGQKTKKLNQIVESNRIEPKIRTISNSS